MGELQCGLSSHDILFEPLQIGSKVFRNRFYSVPHASFHVGRRNRSDVGFRRMKAEGGWAAVCGGVVSIRDDSWGGFVPRSVGRRGPGCDRADGRPRCRDRARWRASSSATAGRVGEGAKFTPSLGASQLADPDRGRLVPKEMDLDDIRRLQDDWVASAITAADLGYDIVYAYGAHGYVPAQFLSPWFNRRTDAYGGSLENRARFWLEMIERFRAEHRRSLPDRGAHRGRELRRARGVGRGDARVHPTWPTSSSTCGTSTSGTRWARDSAAWRVASGGIPGRVVGQGALGDIEADRRCQPADDAGCDGRDPPLRRVGLHRRRAARHRRSVPAPQDRGRSLRRHPRVHRRQLLHRRRDAAAQGCRACRTRRSARSTGAGGIPNAVAPALDRDRNVLVVGAGPAGMECARVLGERGFANVHLVDDMPEPGGHFSWLTRLPGLGSSRGS